MHAPARQHSSGLKRSRVRQQPHPANQSQGTNSTLLFLFYVCTLVEQRLHLVLQSALCSLTRSSGALYLFHKPDSGMPTSSVQRSFDLFVLFLTFDLSFEQCLPLKKKNCCLCHINISARCFESPDFF